jgi:cyclin-dependent kinase 7
MAVSPLIVPPANAGDRSASKSKLSSAIPSSNGTPAEGVSAGNGSSHDLAEQMNDVEKQKYVKGFTVPAIPTSSTTSC